MTGTSGAGGFAGRTWGPGAPGEDPEARAAAEAAFGGTGFGDTMRDAGFKGRGDGEPARAESDARSEQDGDEAPAEDDDHAMAHEDPAADDDADGSGVASGEGAEAWAERPDDGGPGDGSWADPSPGGPAGAGAPGA